MLCDNQSEVNYSVWRWLMIYWKFNLKILISTIIFKRKEKHFLLTDLNNNRIIILN